MKAEEFGQYLKELRKERKLTIRQLDMYSKVSHSYISQLERGARGIPSPDILQKLAKPLGISYEKLMEKAGYITKEEIFKTAIFEGLLTNFDDVQVENVEAMKLLLEDPDKLFELAGNEATTAFLNEILGDKTYEEYWESITNKLLAKKGLDPKKAKVVMSELENMSENEIDDVIDFIRFKKSKIKEK